MKFAGEDKLKEISEKALKPKNSPIGPVPMMNKTIYSAEKEYGKSVEKHLQTAQTLVVQMAHLLVPLINVAEPTEEQDRISEVSHMFLKLKLVMHYSESRCHLND